MELQMSFEFKEFGSHSAWVKRIGPIVYINASADLKFGLESLGIQNNMMQVVDDVKKKFRCFCISEYQVDRVLTLIPDLKDLLLPLKEEITTPKKKWPENIVLDERLYPYQIEGVKWAIANQGGYIADEPGLGKTIQALQWLENSPYTKALVIAPASVVFNWKDETLEWAKSWMPFALGTASNIRKTLSNPRFINSTEKIVYCMTWSQLANCGQYLMNFGFETVIFDEAHRAKSMWAKRTIHARALAKKVESILLLSGTPIKSYPAELYPQISMLTSSFGSFEDFINRYSPPDEVASKTGTYKVFRRAKNLPELRRRVSPFMIFRKKADVLKDLPEIRYRKLILPVENTIMTKWEYLKEQMINGELDTAELIRYREIVGIKKAKSAIEWIDENSSPENPLVVFFVHKKVRALLEKELAKRNITFGTIVGGTPKKKRNKNIKDFQNGSLQIMLCSQAGQEGITLTKASQLLLLERMWVPTDEEQCEARIHRIGAKNACIITHAHAEKTIDDLLVSKLAKKREIIDQMFQGHLLDDNLLSLFIKNINL
jgi:SWI/SNF-related matrix-associated actin-dependent regulator 1 of chromatin subfamily A